VSEVFGDTSVQELRKLTGLELIYGAETGTMTAGTAGSPE
jgi:hypothetical protein